MAGRSNVIGLTLAILVGALALQAPVRGAPPGGGTQLTFQARLTATDGQPLDGLLALSFRIHDAQTGGAPLWQEEHDGGALPRVVVRRGLLTVVLGQAQPLTAEVFSPAGGARRFVAVAFEGDELARVELTASAYAVTASVTSALWDPASGQPLDLPALDLRFGGAGVTTLNGQSGAVQLVAGSNVTVAVEAGGLVRISAGGGVPDPLSVNTLNAGGVNCTQIHTNGITAETLQVNQQIVAVNGLQANSANMAQVTAGSISASNVNAGNLFVSGTKAFCVPHPRDEGLEIVYGSLEGPESGMYVRGEAALVNGTVSIPLPEHFAALALPGSVTVQVTPRDDCKGLYVPEKAGDRITVRELAGGTSGARFDWQVTARRAELDVVRSRRGK